MSEAKRIQRKRTKGWQMPEGAVYVGRPSKWGNPFSIVQQTPWPRWAGAAPWQVVGPDGESHYPEDDRKPIVGRAEADWARRVKAAQLAVDLFTEHAKIPNPAQLAGHDLVCWCPPGQPCHADVLLELANPPGVSGVVAEKVVGK